jgi:uncharacterized protein (DUF2147 family)
MAANSINMKTKVLFPALLAALLATPSAALAKAPIEGRWVNPKGSVTVRIGACGDGYCGTVIDASAKARETARKGGTPNLIGTQVMSDFRDKGDGTYRGRAFDPKRNIRAAATIRMIGNSTLVVKGCLIRGIICKEQRWKKVG